MIPAKGNLTPEDKILFDLHFFEVRKKIDYMFAVLLVFQWALCITIALMTSPLSWKGTQSSIHPHLLLALFLGGSLTLYPIYFLIKMRGQEYNKYLVCVSQMIYSILLIHLTGGRIETHFHIFGSLAFLAFYRDAKIIVIATLITAFDHFFRGAFMPYSIYGVAEASNWRAFEHAAWVIFENVFLLTAIREGILALQEMAIRENLLSHSLQNIEKIVEARTRELRESQELVFEQQQSLAISARLSSLGEMAAGIAHEINNPLAIITSTTKFMRKIAAKGALTEETISDCLTDVDTTVLRISKIISGLRNISRDSTDEGLSYTSIESILSDVQAICSERFKNHSVDFKVIENGLFLDSQVNCRRVQISQVVLNLVSNSFDAIADSKLPKWIHIILEKGLHSEVIIKISDSGLGISDEIGSKIFNPFFTTKDIGKGTGLGLSLSKSIMENHGGSLFLDKSTPNTQFCMVIPGLAKAS